MMSTTQWPLLACCSTWTPATSRFNLLKADGGETGSRDPLSVSPSNIFEVEGEADDDAEDGDVNKKFLFLAMHSHNTSSHSTTLTLPAFIYLSELLLNIHSINIV